MCSFGIPIACQSFLAQWHADTIRVPREGIIGPVTFAQLRVVEFVEREGRVETLHAYPVRWPLDCGSVQLQKAALFEGVRDDGDVLRVGTGQLSEADDGEDEVLVGVGGICLQGEADSGRKQGGVMVDDGLQDAGVAFGFAARSVGSEAAGEDEEGLRVGMHGQGRSHDMGDKGLMFTRLSRERVRAREGLQNPLILRCVSAVAHVDAVATYQHEVGGLGHVAAFHEPLDFGHGACLSCRLPCVSSRKPAGPGVPWGW